MGLASGKRREGEQQWAVQRTNSVVTVSRASVPGQRIPIHDAFVAGPAVHPGAQSLGGVRLLCDPMACSPPGPSVHGFSRQEYWTGLPFPSPGDLPAPGNQQLSPESPEMTGGFFTPEPPGKPCPHTGGS